MQGFSVKFKICSGRWSLLRHGSASLFLLLSPWFHAAWRLFPCHISTVCCALMKGAGLNQLPREEDVLLPGAQRLEEFDRL